MNLSPNKTNWFAVAFAILVILVCLAVGINVIGEYRIGKKVGNDRKLVKSNLESVWASVESMEAAGEKSESRICEQVIAKLKQQPLVGFFVRESKSDEEPFVVYEGPLTHPYVMVMFRSGGITQWAIDDWQQSSLRSESIAVARPTPP